MKVGNKVRLKEYPTMTGLIHGRYKDDWFVLELDKGFWSQDERHYVRLYVVHKDGLESCK